LFNGINRCKYRQYIETQRIGGILYDRGGKPGSNYPDLEPGKEFWNRVWVPGSNYKSLIDSISGHNDTNDETKYVACT